MVSSSHHGACAEEVSIMSITNCNLGTPNSNSLFLLHRVLISRANNTKFVEMKKVVVDVDDVDDDVVYSLGDIVWDGQAECYIHAAGDMKYIPLITAFY